MALNDAGASDLDPLLEAAVRSDQAEERDVAQTAKNPGPAR